MANGDLVIAVLGGTGALGFALAGRWARAGYTVIIGSRDAGRAASRAREIEVGPAQRAPTGMSNVKAAAAADLSVLAVPYASQADTLATCATALAGKTLITAAVPLQPPKVGTVQLPSSGSAAMEARHQLPSDVALVSAFQNVAAEKLMGRDPVDCDVLVCGDDKAACATAIRLAEAAGLRGIHAGPLANSAATEALTSLLITINRRFKVRGAGIRITDIPA